MKPTTIMPETKNEALAIANGLFRMNAKYAVVYAFTQGKSPRYGVNLGERLYRSELDQLTRDNWDAYIDLKTNKLVVL